MITRLHWVLEQFTSQLWFRVSLYGLAAMLSVLLAGWAAPLVPRGIAERIGDTAVRDLLEIVASSMLLVATFSLGTMVAAFSAASGMATPRAARILIADPISQNVLGTFIGAFVFSIVGLVALSLGYYATDGRAVLLLGTALVILAVIVTLFGWLDYLVNLVRLGAIVDKIEAHAADVIRERLRYPGLGGHILTEVPDGSHPVTLADTGYIANLDVRALQEVAEAAGGTICVTRTPGSVAGPAAPVAWTSWTADTETQASIGRAFAITAERSFEEDPRYGLIVLAEIASRALSPGINDPGTAIGIVVRLQRLLTIWARGSAVAEAPHCPRVHVAAPAAGDLIEDAFGPLARDGAPMVEVGLRLQKSLAALAGLGDAAVAEAAKVQSARALEQAERALVLASDVERLRAEAARVSGSEPRAS
jgi:uncharacterized membrane protein